MADDPPPSSDRRNSGGWLSRLLRRFREPPADRQDLREMLDKAQEARLLDPDVMAMIEGAIEVSELQVRDIMIPRSQMVVIERDGTPGDILGTIIESGHSRFPVIGEDRDEVVGILLAKDLLRYFAESDGGRFAIREVLRPPVFIPESKRLNILLREFRASHNHMAIVVDEYGGVSGLLTIEDVLEQIVGDIGDEHDPDEIVYVQREEEGTYSVRALTRIDDFNEQFGTDLDDEEYDTIGGLVIHQLGRLPRRGESVTMDGVRFTILKADRRRVYTLRAQFPRPDADA
jgi:magnesium and cobalt transporter